jgi:hypothetical protein
MGVILSYLYYKTDVLVSDDHDEVFDDVLHTTKSRYSETRDSPNWHIYDYNHIRPRSIHLLEDYGVKILQ